MTSLLSTWQGLLARSGEWVLFIAMNLIPVYKQLRDNRRVAVLASNANALVVLLRCSQFFH